jgi:hypothetical protein
MKKQQFSYSLKNDLVEKSKTQKISKILNKKYSPCLIAVKSFLKIKPFFFKKFEVNKDKKEYFSINIKCSQNNVFCTLANVLSNKIVFSCSAGKYNVSISRKSLRYNVIPVLTYFFQEIKQITTKAKILIVIFTLPINLKKNVLSFVFSQIYDKTKKKTIFFVLKNKKCFNGCKSKKKKRKKHKVMRFLKY